jgi:hypothetical protein
MVGVRQVKFVMADFPALWANKPRRCCFVSHEEVMRPYLRWIAIGEDLEGNVSDECSLLKDKMRCVIADTATSSSVTYIGRK